MLNYRQKKFCQEYLKSGNATRAAIIAGYSEQTANEQGARLLANVSVKKYITEFQSKIEKKNILSAQQLQEELTRYILDEKEEECIVIESNCDKSSTARKMTKKVQPKDKLKAIELLCKLAGYNVEKGKITAPVTINFNRNYD